MLHFGVSEPHIFLPNGTDKYKRRTLSKGCGTSKVQVGLQNEKPEVAQTRIPPFEIIHNQK